MTRPRPRAATAARVAWGVGVASLGLGHALSLRWISDDAYISLRYARNWSEGLGLVFNAGERVEGYTNFLWTGLLALGLEFGAPAEGWTTALGLICSSGCLLAVLRLRRAIAPQGAIPFAALALALSYSWASFSTGGLETSLLALLLVGAFSLLFEGAGAAGEAAGRRKLVAAGTLIALALMTRPDAALVAPVALGYLISKLQSRRARLAAVALVVAPLAILYLPYFFWRWDYYDYFFPNAYYAKGIGEPNYRQGWLYLWEFARCDYMFALLPWPLLGIWKLRGRSGRQECTALLAFCLLHIAYVVRVGGDFMEGRFFVPVLPFLFLLGERAVRDLLPGRPAPAVLTLWLALTALGHRPLGPQVIEHGITDERSWAATVKQWRRAGEVFARQLPPDTRVATDAIGAFGFASRLPILDTHGLTDERVAHQPLVARRRPGHEKIAPFGYLAQRNVAVLRDVGLYRLRRPFDFEHGGNRYYLLTSRPDVVAGFRRAMAELSRSATPAWAPRPAADGIE